MANYNFSNKVVIVTGAGRGIGAAIAKEFSKNGASIVLADINKEFLLQTENEMKPLGLAVCSFICDVSNLDSTVDLINFTVEKFDKVDILVNNAGITRDNLIMRMKETEWEQVLSINLTGTYHCIKSATRQMMKQRFGCIINIASVIGQMGNAGQANYAASKAGIIGLTKSVAREFSSRNITCNAIAPGFIQTEMTAVLEENVVNNLKNQIPLGRLGTVEDVAKVACFLASEDASYITGQVINVDGGMVMM
jgi:3-oxoacyl-[acyl-carrier protein] reductase